MITYVITYVTLFIACWFPSWSLTFSVPVLLFQSRGLTFSVPIPKLLIRSSLKSYFFSWSYRLYCFTMVFRSSEWSYFFKHPKKKGCAWQPVGSERCRWVMSNRDQWGELCHSHRSPFYFTFVLVHFLVKTGVTIVIPHSSLSLLNTVNECW